MENPIVPTQEERKSYYPQQVHEESFFSPESLLRVLILNWYWFVLSIAACGGLAYAYSQYEEPVYTSSTKLLIKDEEKSYLSRSRGMLAAADQLGMMSESFGVENEQEILKSTYLAQSVVRNLGLNVTHYVRHNYAKRIVYKKEPVVAFMDLADADKLNSSVQIQLKTDGRGYTADITYFVPTSEFEHDPVPTELVARISQLPAAVSTKVGKIHFRRGPGEPLESDQTELITIRSPQRASFDWDSKLTMGKTSKMTSVVVMTVNDVSVQRSVDYLRELINCYNQQANDDKNEKAEQTAKFISDRLGIMTSELTQTDERILAFKEDNQMLDLRLTASTTFQQVNEYQKQLSEMDVQVELINSFIDFANRPGNENKVLPSNIGLQDNASTQLINSYNALALERNRLLNSASTSSPVVVEITDQLKSVRKSIDEALTQNKLNIAIQRESVQSMLNKYISEVAKTPEQEQFLTQIGRQQEIQQKLYLTLLEKREENLIQIASKVNKAKLIEAPCFNKQVSPRVAIILLIGLLLGAVIPFLCAYIHSLFNNKIQDRDVLRSLTTLPIIADIAVANEKAKERGDIVVRKYTNNQMAEIFRLLRSNIMFMLPENKNIIMFTSSVSGEGKTFVAANLAISFALLEKKVVLIGLDIRRPRLGKLFKLKHRDTENGISTLLKNGKPTWESVSSAIVSSEVNTNLDLLMAGPTPPNPSELIERDTLGEILDILSEKYDYVIIDTAPIGLVTDTVNIARFSDVTVYVCRADYTQKQHISIVNDLVEENKFKNVGIVFNGIDMSRSKHAYAYGYKRSYGYGYRTYKSLGTYGTYHNSKYGDKNDKSVKR